MTIFFPSVMSCRRCADVSAWPTGGPHLSEQADVVVDLVVEDSAVGDDENGVEN